MYLKPNEVICFAYKIFDSVFAKFVLKQQADIC